MTEAQPIAIDVFEGPRLTLRASASQTTVAAGGSVTFTASVSPANQGKLTYAWNFDGRSHAPPRRARRCSSTPEVNTSSPSRSPTKTAAAAARRAHRSTSPSTPTTTNPNGPRTGPKQSAGPAPGGRQGKKTTHAGSPNAGNNANGNRLSERELRHHDAAPDAGGRRPEAGGANERPAEPTHRPVAATPDPRTDTKDRSHSAAHGSEPATGLQPSAANPNPLAVPVNGLLISDVTPIGAGASPLVHVVQAPPATAPAIRTPPERRRGRLPGAPPASCCCSAWAPPASCADGRDGARWASAADASRTLATDVLPISSD